ncbi:MBL fold metallo-hydrolase [Patescibacteria group bacterium]|nr:MBL fold metallo-hydrolase [Patescibacteria group bacterium]MBU1663629.1 MBL fold metallo-hydrolase [Patescibacteria group bacterium]MBU1933879.1 MBL fold metallo-hydrolase [Patescibacteria group bacterium]MBU2007764.1 MBL fold metallo-hydrolase [Patescibacteria group bacterium]MBU2233419.1 MBL fold metallo-hydrolase [Patescibacteria group bacterium]
MSSKLYKILLILGIVACLAAVFLFWLYCRAPKNLEIDFLDVGQGDAILIKAPAGQNILIDGGPDRTIIKRLAENLPWWDKQIDLMILTHPHDDHVTGLIDVLKRYQVKKILYTGVIHNAPNYLAWLKLVRDKKVPITIIDKQQIINLNQGAKMEILYPNESLLNKTVDDLNQSSIVLMLTYGQNKFLLTGDAGELVEKNLIVHGADLRADVLKVGHHGSKYSSSQEFLDKVKPRLAVIMVGKDNDFAHPSLRIVKRLERIGAEIFRTDLDGTVRMISNGANVQIK